MIGNTYGVAAIEASATANCEKIIDMATRRLTVHNLASQLMRYRDGLSIQERLASARRAGDDAGDHLLLLQAWHCACTRDHQKRLLLSRTCAFAFFR